VTLGLSVSIAAAKDALIYSRSAVHVFGWRGDDRDSGN